MRLPQIEGEIQRRLLVNYRVNPEAVARVLPPPFRPQLVGDAAVAGICLIRLAHMRPTYLPAWLGLRSENAAHRVAVEWDTPRGPRTGVYIPRRDSDSMANILLGGRVYPGEHHRARFTVNERDDHVAVAFTSVDGSTGVDVSVRVAQRLTGSRLFADSREASDFFEAGSIGFSATRQRRRFDGLGLKTSAWKIQPTTIDHASSSHFDDPTLFPTGSAELDCALLMRRIPVTWQPLQSLSGHTTAVA